MHTTRCPASPLLHPIATTPHKQLCLRMLLCCRAWFQSSGSAWGARAAAARCCTMRQLCAGKSSAAAAAAMAAAPTAACSRRSAVWHASSSSSSSRSSNNWGARRGRATAAPSAAPAPPAAAAAATAAAAAMVAAPQLQAPPLELSFADRPGVWDCSGTRVRLKSLTFAELREWVASTGADASKALPLWKALYQDGRWARSFDEDERLDSGSSSTGSKGVADLQLPRSLKAAVAAGATLDAGMTLQSAQTARDGTHKLVFALHGSSSGDAAGSSSSSAGSVETVLIPMYTKRGTQRYTACLSCQVGCAMNCQFCLTGRMGLLRNLSTAQIVEQLVEARRWLAAYHSSSSSSSSGQASQASQGSKATQQQQQQPPRINNIVFMGMGEPFHNPDGLWPSLDILTSPQGLGLSRNKVIVSTVGLLPEIRRLRASGAAKLAVSLHATTEELRSWLVPANRKYPLTELVATLEELYPLHPPGSQQQQQQQQQQDPEQQQPEQQQDPKQQQQQRKPRPASDDFVVIEYVLLRDVNDSEDDARRLLQLLSRVYCMINLIVFNPHEGTLFQRTDGERAARFLAILQAGGKVATLRSSKGDDEMAACGQLGGASMDLALRPAPLLRPPAALAAALPGAAAAAAALPPRRARPSQLQRPEEEGQQAAAEVSVG